MEPTTTENEDDLLGEIDELLGHEANRPNPAYLSQMEMALANRTRYPYKDGKADFLAASGTALPPSWTCFRIVCFTDSGITRKLDGIFSFGLRIAPSYRKMGRRAETRLSHFIGPCQSENRDIGRS